MATRRNNRSTRKSNTTPATDTVIGSGGGALSLSDVKDGGVIRKMHIVLTNGKEGDLYYRTLTTRESRQYNKDIKEIQARLESDPDGNINHTRKFLASHLINPDGSPFCTEDDLDNIAIDDLNLIFKRIADSMVGRGTEGNASETTVN